MKKTVHNIKTAYIFDPTSAHKGAHYSTNGGENWMNHGDFCEVIAKDALGFPAYKDANGTYDKTSDIPALRASVKSSKATLVNKVLGYDFDSCKSMYFATVHSTMWIWVSLIDDTVTLYYMNAVEFEAFLDKWATFDKSRKVIRFKVESGIMREWLEEKIK